MKKLIAVLILCAVTSTAFGLELKYTIPDEKVDEHVANYTYIHKNNEVDSEGELVYTDRQWVREHVRRYYNSQRLRGKKLRYDHERDAIAVEDIQ